MNKKKVFLALSGGVDSAVAAILLKEHGFDVHCFFLKIWSDHDFQQSECRWEKEKRDALAVAAKLNLPFSVLDFEDQYRKQVLSYFVKEYEKGNTPNPDILCNEIIKFGIFLNFAQSKHADYIATGHHVRKICRGGICFLLQGKDKKKDQSYFLCRLSQHQIKKSLFPVGDYTKKKVRTIAQKNGLGKIAEKKSTKGICFIGKVDLKKFLSEFITVKTGKIKNDNGDEIGEHKGVAFYTIGQRKGLYLKTEKNDSKPYYVIEKNIQDNILVVTDDYDKVKNNEIWCNDVYWFVERPNKFPYKCMVRIRNLQKPQKAIVLEKGDKVIIRLKKRLSGIAPGQFAVFYKKDVMIGSAIIE